MADGYSFLLSGGIMDGETVERALPEIVANQIVFLGSRAENPDAPGVETDLQRGPAPQPEARKPEVEITDDDIPF